MRFFFFFFSLSPFAPRPPIPSRSGPRDRAFLLTFGLRLGHQGGQVGQQGGDDAGVLARADGGRDGVGDGRRGAGLEKSGEGLDFLCAL